MLLALHRRATRSHRPSMAMPLAAAPYRASGLVHRHETDLSGRRTDVCFSNRPFGVKHFQTIHQCDVDVARGLVLLFGIGTGAFPSWDSRTRRNNLLVGLAVEERRVQADIRTHLIHRPARDIFPPLGGALVFSYRVHAAAVACSLVQQNSVPSTHMRCMITASRRAKATIAFFIPRRLAICMAHALSQDHFFECIMPAAVRAARYSCEAHCTPR